MKKVWKTTGEKTSYLGEGKYIAVRINEYRIVFFPYPKCKREQILKYIEDDLSGLHDND